MQVPMTSACLHKLSMRSSKGVIGRSSTHTAAAAGTRWHVFGRLHSRITSGYVCLSVCFVNVCE